MALLDKLQTFDRRWLFLAMGFAIVVPLLWPLGLPFKPSAPVKAIYYTIEELPENSVVLVSGDFDPASTAELEPYFRATMAHLKQRKAKVVLVTLWPKGPPLVERWTNETLGSVMFEGDREYVKNIDYVWLGFKEGKEAVIANMGQNLWGTFADRLADGTPLEKIPWMQSYKRLADFPLIVLVSAGFPGAKEWVQQVQSRYKLKMVAACTAVSTTDLSPYYASGQLLGLAGGMSATAEYEGLVARRLKGHKLVQGAKALDVLNIGHVVVILAIILGNIIYFTGRRRDRKAGVQ
jgi:hypothetical protein